MGEMGGKDGDDGDGSFGVASFFVVEGWDI